MMTLFLWLMSKITKDELSCRKGRFIEFHWIPFYFFLQNL